MSSEKACVKVLVRCYPPQVWEESSISANDDQPGLITICAPAADGSVVTERRVLFDEEMSTDTH